MKIGNVGQLQNSNKEKQPFDVAFIIHNVRVVKNSNIRTGATQATLDWYSELMSI